jgi:nucleotide-binding universal stress UspA family protein
VSLLRSAADPPDPATVQPERVLLASEGREISAGAVEFAARLARQGGGAVHVLSIARVWGSGLGLPNPGLLPNKSEWDEQRDVVRHAVKALKRHGVKAEGHVLATRKATKRIVSEAERLGCGVIVMAADRPRNRFVADFIWSQEPYRVRRRAGVPVYLVTDER